MPITFGPPVILHKMWRAILPAAGFLAGLTRMFAARLAA